MLKISLGPEEDGLDTASKPKRSAKGSSVIDFPAEYIGIDVETTGLDYQFDAIIEIAALHVKDGTVIDRFSSLMRPSAPKGIISFGAIQKLGYDSFTDVPFDVFEQLTEDHWIPEDVAKRTGITNEMIKSAPPVSDVIPEFYKFIENRVLVGHNVNFDINFIYDACEDCGLLLENNFIDTMRISRKLFPELEHHRLPDVVSCLGLTPDTAHRAENDAKTAIDCFEAMKRLVLQSKTIDEFKNEFRSHKSRNYQNSLGSITADTDTFDETHPLYGKVVVFTGALSTMSRKEAFQIVANLGGHPEDKITKKTNFLVIGNSEFSNAMQNGKTTKMKKADAYREKGQDIITLSESTFFQMIDLE